MDPVDPPPPLRALVDRTDGLQPWRRLFHAASGVTLAWMVGPWSPASRWIVPALAVLVLLLLAVDLVRLRASWVNRLFFSLFPALVSPREENRPASSTFFVLGILVTALIAPPGIALPAVLVLALADPAASYVGRRWGRMAIGDGSLEGTLVFATIAFGVLVLFTDPWTALAATAVATVVERVGWGLDDNFTVPVATAAALLLLR